MTEVIAIDPNVMEKAYASSRAYFKTFSWKNKSFFQNLHEKDDTTLPIPSEGFFYSYKSLEQMLAGYYALKETLLKDSGFYKKAEAETFINMYACFGGICKGLHYLHSFFPEETVSFQNGNLINFRNGSTINALMSIYFEKMNEKINSGKKIALYTKSFYQYLFETIDSWKDVPTIQPFVSLAESMHIQMEDSLLSGFSVQPYRTPLLEEKKPVMLIGVEDVVLKLEKYAKQLFLYDLSAKLNIEVGTIPRTILLYSQPGTGKSSIVNGLIQVMKKYSSETGKPFQVAQIDNSIKNMYHGESVKNLARLLLKTTHPETIGLVIIDDIDMVLQSRNDPFASHAELQIVAELMQYISGIHTNVFLGNHMNIFMTNAPQKIDPAILHGRIEETLFVKGPTTSQEYKMLLSNLLDEYAKDNLLALDDLDTIAEECKQKKLSGREIKNIAKLLQTHIIGEGPSIDICCLEPNEQKNIRKKMYRPIKTEEMRVIFNMALLETQKASSFVL
jgi:AAA+ superfamily predicted ATPase